MAMAMAMAITGGPCLPANTLFHPPLRPYVSHVSLPLKAAGCSSRTLAFHSSSLFGGVSLKSAVNKWLPFAQRNISVKVWAGKASLACTKRSRSRVSRARTSGFRARLQTPAGRNILRRRRAKGRKVLCPASNPNSGKRA
eukprot:c18518_g1_i1 orf=1-420(+)